MATENTVDWEEEDWEEPPRGRGALWFGGFLLLLALVAGTWFFWQSVLQPRAAEDHVQEALLYLNEGNPKAAYIELRNAIQTDENNALAHYLLGKLYLDNGEYVAAEPVLRRARFLGHPDNQVVPLLARTYLELGKSEELLELGANALPVDSGALVPDKWRAGKPGAKQDGTLTSAVAATAAREHDALNRAQALFEQGNYPAARKAIETLLASSEAHAGALKLLGDIELQTGNLDAAELAYGRSIKHSLNPSDAQLKRALVRIRKGDLMQAQRDVNELMRRIPNHPSVHYAQGVLHFENERYEDAVASLVRAEHDERRYPQALLYAGISHYMLFNYDQAATYGNRYHALMPNDVHGRRLLALTDLIRGDYESAVTLLLPVVAGNPQDWASANLLANAMLAQGNMEEGLTYLERVAELQPDSSDARARLGAGQLLAGNTGAGAAQLQEAVRLNPDFQQADTLLVLSHVRQGEFDKALAAARDWRQRAPDSAEPLNLMGRVYQAAGDQEQAEQAYREALTIDADAVDPRHGLAQIAIERGDFAAARDHYETALEIRPDYLPTLIKLAELSAQEGDAASMVLLLGRAINQHPQRAEPRVLLARYYLSTGDYGRIMPLFTDVDSAIAEQPDVLDVIARVELAQGKYLEAKGTLSQLVARRPGVAEHRYQLAVAQGALGETDAMQRSLQKALELDPEHAPSHLVLARQLLDQGKLNEAKPHIETLRRQSLNSADMYVLESRYASLYGNADKALELARKAYETAPSSQTLLLMVDLQHESGDAAAAQELLQQWLQQYPTDTQAQIALANTYALDGDTAGAVRKYQSVLELDPSNVVALNNLAWYLQDSQPRLALIYAERAAELAPNWAAAQDTLALLLLQNGHTVRADEVIERALKAAPNDPSVLYHSALIDHRAGLFDSAIRVLRPLLASQQPFPERQDALALYEEIQAAMQ